MFCYGESVFIGTGKYMSYIATFVKYSKCGEFSIVDLDLSPERRIVRLRFKNKNISHYKH